MALQTHQRPQVHDHLCEFYSDEMEGLTSAIHYLKEGLALNDHCVYVVNDNTVPGALQAMEAAGINVKDAVTQGRLAVITKAEAYLPRPYFDPQATAEFFATSAMGVARKGFRGLRGVAEMSWQLDSGSSAASLIEYEASLAELFPTVPLTGNCQYNVRRFPPLMLRDVLFTHPKVVIDGIVHANPYYRPDETDFSQDRGEFNIAEMLTIIAAVGKEEAASA